MKRARNDPSSVLQPLAKRASDTLQMRGGRTSRKNSTDAQAAAVILPPAKTSRSAMRAVIAVLALGLGVIGYLYVQHRAEDSHVVVAPAMTVPPVVATPLPMPALAPLPALANTLAPAIQLVPELPAKPRRRGVKAPVPVVIAPLPQVIAPPVQEVPLPKANIVAVQQPPDRRLQLRQRFAGCANTDVLAKAYCEQRARLELCDGLWGAVPQCPPQRDYGN
ncbi:MAG: hypothetical protein ABI440_07055 [Casimicrobiaceae bacterium]